jgi:hypothetical protein
MKFFFPSHPSFKHWVCPVDEAINFGFFYHFGPSSVWSLGCAVLTPDPTLFLIIKAAGRQLSSGFIEPYRISFFSTLFGYSHHT